jgi:hypothetical protein
MDTVSGNDPWDQLEQESNLWFARFDMFRLLGPSRSIPKTYRKWREREDPNLKYSDWYREAKLYNWDERAAAWDEVNRELQEDRIQEVYGSGLALSHERVAKLILIAEKLEAFILDKKTTRISPFVIEQYRGILDDIAKEKGERLKETRVTGTAGGPILIETSWGRGGSASDAWKQLEAPTIEAIIEEVKDE